jgi:hypothetical protein
MGKGGMIVEMRNGGRRSKRGNGEMIVTRGNGGMIVTRGNGGMIVTRGNGRPRRTCCTADLLKEIVPTTQLCDKPAPLCCYFMQSFPSKAPYTLSVKLSDFTV